MKHRLLVWSSFLVLLLAGTPAFAGDIWNGFYFGGNAGYAWGSGENTLTVSDGASCHFTCPGGTDAASVASAGSPSLSPAGLSGGVQLGYNWQHYDWVYGLEADFGAFSQNSSANTSTGLPANTAALDCNFGDPCVGNFSTSVKTDWLFTLRPRLGYTWEATLVYLTGGLAVSRISVSQSYSDNNPSNPPLAMVSYSGAQTKAGWIVGGGIEQAFNDRWSLKAEYLFVRFDNINAGGRLVDSVGGYADFSNSLRLSSNILRVGFNYRFGGVPQ